MKTFASDRLNILPVRGFRRVFAVCAVIVAAGLVASPAQAQGKGGGKGGGGGSEPGGNGGGEIYVARGADLYVMNDDGSNLRLATGFDAVALDPFGVPSREPHAMKRWWLQAWWLQPTWSPQGLLALSDASDVVELRLQPRLEVTSEPLWGIGDGTVSFLGVRSDGDPESLTFGEPIEGGLYELAYAVDLAGNVTGEAGPAELVFSMPLIVDQNDVVRPDAWSFDWSPDGIRIVYTPISVKELRVADVFSGQEFVLFDGTAELSVGAAFWSPAGDRILFDMHPSDSHFSVLLVDIDGTNLTRIQRGAPGWTRSAAGWSPTGSHLLLEHRDHNLQDSYILRLAADGGGKTRLTPQDFGAGLSRPRVRGWR